MELMLGSSGVVTETTFLCSSSGHFKADLILCANESQGVEFVWVAI